MNLIRRFDFRAASASLLASIFVFLQAAPVSAGNTIPPSDLTITVQELEDGDVEFTVSGTGYAKGSTSFYETPGDSSSGTPPHTLGTNNDSIEIPPGMVLSVPFLEASEPEEGPEQVVDTYDLDLTLLFFNEGGYWTVGGFESYILSGDPIVGSGSVVTSAVPFTHFVPGTYVVTSGEFDITYIVIPFAEIIATSSLGPALSIQKPRRFPNTRVGSWSRSQHIRVRNVGSSPVSGISVKVSGSDFFATQVVKKSLAPGASSSFRATFRPKRAGIRRGTVSVSSNAPKASAGLGGLGVRGFRFPLAPLW